MPHSLGTFSPFSFFLSCICLFWCDDTKCYQHCAIHLSCIIQECYFHFPDKRFFGFVHLWRLIFWLRVLLPYTIFWWYMLVCVCVFLTTSQYTLPKLWGGTVPTSGSGYSRPRLCAYPQYIFKPPYIKDACQWWDKTNKGQTMGTFIGHQCGQLARTFSVQGCPN